MVNGRMLEEELKRIDNFFESLSLEEFEEIAIDCGAEKICLKGKGKYSIDTMKQYKNEIYNKQNNGFGFIYDTVPEDVEVA